VWDRILILGQPLSNHRYRVKYEKEGGVPQRSVLFLKFGGITAGGNRMRATDMDPPFPA